MSDLLNSIEVSFQDSAYNLGAIYTKFADSEWGIHQANQIPRFYKVYGHGEYVDFMNHIGDDAHPVKHMQHTAENIALPFVLAQRLAQNEYRFSNDDEAALLITALIHDIDECEHPFVGISAGCIVGDIPKFQVNDEHEANKRIIRDRFVYRHVYPEFPEELTSRIEEIMTHNENDIVASAFNSIEQIGYVLSGLAAANIAVRHLTSSGDGRLDLVHYNFIRMAARVTANWRKALDDDRYKYPYISDFLTEHRRELRIAEKIGRIIV